MNARWQGTESEFGLTRLASSAEVDAATSSDRVVTPAGLRRNLLAPLASPALTGNPTAPTQTAGNSSTRIATTAFVGTAVAGAGASYVHLATASSTNDVNNWAWGALESGASTYVAIAFNTNIIVLGSAPRGMIGLLFEIYEGSTFRGRVHVDHAYASTNNVYLRLNESTSRIARINFTNSNSPSQNHTGTNFRVSWRTASEATGYEARVYAVVV